MLQLCCSMGLDTVGVLMPGAPMSIDLFHTMGRLAGSFGRTDTTNDNFERYHVDPKERVTTRKHLKSIGRYMRELDAAEPNLTSGKRV